MDVETKRGAMSPLKGKRRRGQWEGEVILFFLNPTFFLHSLIKYHQPFFT